MKTIFLKTIQLVIFIAYLGGCSEADNVPDETAKVTDNPLAYQTKALDKANQVEQQILDAAKKQRQTIDELE